MLQRDGVTIRRATAADAETIFAWRNEPAAKRFQPLKNLPLIQVRHSLEERAAQLLGPELAGELQWLILASDRPVGWITLQVLNREHAVGELGYTVGAAFHRRGYASAAVRLVLPLAFAADGAGLWRLEARAALANVASRTVLERAGFRLEGVARQSALIGGVRVDHARYAMLRSDWDAAQCGSSG